MTIWRGGEWGCFVPDFCTFIVNSPLYTQSACFSSQEMKKSGDHDPVEKTFCGSNM